MQVPDNGGGECTQGGSKGVSEAAMSARAHLEHVTRVCTQTGARAMPHLPYLLFTRLLINNRTPPSTPSFAQCTLCPPSLVYLRLDGMTRREA